MFKCCHVRTLHAVWHNLLHSQDQSVMTSAMAYNIKCVRLDDRIRRIRMYYWCRRKSTRSYLLNKVGLTTGVLRGIVPRRRQLFIILGYPVDRVNKLAVIKVQRQISYDDWTVRDSVHTSVYMWHSFQLETVSVAQNKKVLAYVSNLCKKCVY